MRNLFIFLLSCFMLICVPTTSSAKKKIYIESSTTMDSSGPRRGPEILTIDVDDDACELCITFAEDVTDVVISLTRNGVTYEEDELDAVTGQTVVYDLGNYAIGDYDLTIEVDGVVYAIYIVTIEE